MSPKVVIFGIGRLARSVYFYLTHDSDYTVAAFSVDEARMEAEMVENLPVVPFESIAAAYPPDQYHMIIAVGYRQLNQLRIDKYRAAKKKGYRLISYVSSKTTCWDPTHIGDNCIIFEKNVIQPFAEVGNGVIIWCGVHVGTGTRIGNHCYVGSNAVLNGGVIIGSRSFIGANATIQDGATIGPDCIIGAGACIFSDTAAKEVYVSRPTERFRWDSECFSRMLDAGQ